MLSEDIKNPSSFPERGATRSPTVLEVPVQSQLDHILGHGTGDNSLNAVPSKLKVLHGHSL